MSMHKSALVVTSTLRAARPAVLAPVARACRAAWLLAVYLTLLVGAEPAHAQEVELKLADSSASTCGDCPYPPTGYAVPGPDIGEISVRWQPSGSSGRPEAVRWYVFLAEVGNSDGGVGHLLGRDARRTTFTMLSPGTDYRVAVRGVSAARKESLDVTATVRARSEPYRVSRD